MSNNLQIKRGIQLNLPTALSGELLFTTDTKRLYVGDGSTNNLVQGSDSVFTTGSIPFSNSSGKLTTDSSNFYWDDTNNRLGIGTILPTANLHIKAYGALATDIPFRIRNSSDTADLMNVNGLGDTRINSNLNIATTTTVTVLRVNNSSGNIDFGRIGTDAVIQVAGIGRLFINNNGNVAIGPSSTAGARLDVRAQGALSTDIALRVRNSADTADIIRANGAGDVFIGLGAGAVTTGTNNTFLGIEAGNKTTTGVTNTAIGYRALYSNIGGSDNTVIGTQAQYYGSGVTNVSIGYQSMMYNGSGSNNVAIGNQALYENNAGSNNIGIGNIAGKLITAGTNNISGIDSIFLGRDTRAADAGQTNQIVIGATAIGIGSNTVVLGNDSIVTTALKGSVGIGTTAPTVKLDVIGNEMRFAATTGAISFYNSPGVSQHFNFINVRQDSDYVFKQNVGGIVNTTTLTLKGLNGNLLLNTTTDNGGKLQIKAPGALSTDIAFKVRNSADTSDIMTVSGTGGIISASSIVANNSLGFQLTGGTLNINGTGTYVRFNFGFSVYPLGFIFEGYNYTQTSGLTQFHQLRGSFAPTSGTAEFIGTNITPTINQTGGANGITRGLYVNPTLTAAADFRAIETTVGNVILGSTSGNVGIGTTAPDYPLHIFRNTTNNYIQLSGNTNKGLYAEGAGLLAFDTSGNFRIYTGGVNERVIVNSTGNVGIGTTTPTAKLHVAAPGALSTDIALRIRNSADTANLLDVNGIGDMAIATGSKFLFNGITGNNGFVSAGNSFLQLLNRGLCSLTAFNGGNEANMQVQIGYNLPYAVQPPNLASAILDVVSTTKGFLPPRMTTTQKNAIATPATGLIVYDITLLSLFQYNGTAWTAVGGSSLPVKLTSQTLTLASWTLVGSYYEYSFSNANIDTTSDITVTPQNASYQTAYNANILPYVAVASGVATFYAQFPPQANMVVDIVITQTA